MPTPALRLLRVGMVARARMRGLYGILVAGAPACAACADQVKEGRARGYPVFYGDASAKGVIEAAGIANPRAFVVTYTDTDANLVTRQNKIMSGHVCGKGRVDSNTDPT